MTFERKDVYPLRVSKKRYDKTVHLLYVGDMNKGHYISIVNISLFLGRKGDVTRHYCLYCLNKFTTREKRDIHQEECKQFGLMVMKFPQPKADGSPPVVEFSDYQKTLWMGFTAYADFEGSLIGLTEQERVSLSSSSTTYVKRLEPIAYGILLIGPHGYHKYVDYCGPNVVKHFLQTALAMADYCLDYMATSDMGIPELTDEQQQEFEETKECMFCKKGFEKYPKCRHHHPVINYYIGVACSYCNTLVRKPTYLPINIHNSKNFDNAFILTGLSHEFVTDVKIIPHNTQKFISIKINKVQILDSYLKTQNSLQGLVEMQKHHTITHTSSLWPIKSR